MAFPGLVQNSTIPEHQTWWHKANNYKFPRPFAASALNDQSDSLRKYLRYLEEKNVCPWWYNLLQQGFLHQVFPSASIILTFSRPNSYVSKQIWKRYANTKHDGIKLISSNFEGRLQSVPWIIRVADSLCKYLRFGLGWEKKLSENRMEYQMNIFKAVCCQCPGRSKWFASIHSCKWVD